MAFKFYDEMTNTKFVDWFVKNRPEQYSHEALNHLYDYYSELPDEISEDIEFDPIDICCTWIEYDTLEEINKDNFELDREDYNSEEAYHEAIIEECNNTGTFIELKNSYLFTNQ